MIRYGAAEVWKREREIVVLRVKTRHTDGLRRPGSCSY